MIYRFICDLLVYLIKPIWHLIKIVLIPKYWDNATAQETFEALQTAGALAIAGSVLLLTYAINQVVS